MVRSENQKYQKKEKKTELNERKGSLHYIGVNNKSHNNGKRGYQRHTIGVGCTDQIQINKNFPKSRKDKNRFRQPTTAELLAKQKVRRPILGSHGLVAGREKISEKKAVTPL